MPRNSEQLGRTDQKVGVFTPRQQAIISMVSGLALTAVLWHVTVVLLAGVPVGRPAATLRAVMAGHPLAALSPQYQPPLTGRALLVWLGLMVLVSGGWAGPHCGSGSPPVRGAFRIGN